VTKKPNKENFDQLPIQVLQILFQTLVGLNQQAHFSCGRIIRTRS